MEKVNPKLKSVLFSLEVDKEFTKLAQKHGRAKNELFVQMVKFFVKTGRDPDDLNDDALKNVLSKKIDNVIAFIKTQENKILVPLLANSELVNSNLKKIADYLVKSNQENIANIKPITDKLNLLVDKYYQENERLEKELAEVEQSKIIQKNEVLKMFNQYIEEREQLGITSGSGAKQDLILKFKNGFKQL